VRDPHVPCCGRSVALCCCALLCPAQACAHQGPWTDPEDCNLDNGTCSDSDFPSQSLVSDSLSCSSPASPPRAPFSSPAAAALYSTHNRRCPLDNVLTPSSLDHRPSCPSLFVFSLRVLLVRLSVLITSLCARLRRSLSRFSAILKRAYASIPLRPRHSRQAIRVLLLLEPRPASLRRTVLSRAPVVYQPPD